MITFRYYDEEKKVDHVWYDSSNILYSECDDIPDSLKTLRITFKGGDTYRYDDVDVNDYVLFASGGPDASNGKAFNRFIRKYKYEKIDKIPVERVKELLEEYKKKSEEKIIISEQGTTPIMTVERAKENCKPGWHLNENPDVVNAIIKAINRTVGCVCPCNNDSEDKQCACSNYRLHDKCCCGLYIKD